jgi:hypothetical protein
MLTGLQYPVRQPSGGHVPSMTTEPFLIIPRKSMRQPDRLVTGGSRTTICPRNF